ncbi:MAG TPA: TetR/AcrR family transcriptional regulator [Solirubrobacteraceae bacterium]|jgi:AcrR family transcriptional regulator|nr:TetR/AcrR family transcriptional regulator [Solirubrobacteraceae bacterium]
MSTTTSVTTRERIIDEAMRLFSEHGYAATSIAKIEAAAGLTPGAGGLYHHFKSKEAVMMAGIERQLARLDALRQIRSVLTPLGDVKSELTLIARYILAELDSESDLLRILASEARSRPQLLTAAVDRLVSSTFDGFASWIAECSEQALSGEQATATAVLGLGSLFSSRLLRDVLGVPMQLDDQTLVDAWVRWMLLALDRPT